MKDIRATARIQITLEVDADSPWGPECSVSQVYKQAAESALTKLHNGLKIQSYRVIGTPKIIGIITEET